MTTQPDPQKQEPQTQNTAPTGDDPEKGFWERLDKAVEAAADRVVEKRLREIRGTGTQRTDGRKTIPDYIAGFLYGNGPDKQ